MRTSRPRPTRLTHAVTHAARLGFAVLVVVLGLAPRVVWGADAGAYGVSPVGEFADWSQEPAALQTFVECLLVDPSLSFAGAPLRSLERLHPRVGGAAPWLLLGGLAALAAALWRARDLRRKWPWLLGLFGAALALRAVAAPWAFFHQNGQGPLWIDYALGEPSLRPGLP